MYESPVKLIVDQMYTQFLREQEDNVYKAVQQYGINVDKEELIRALQYDRQQYEKGYSEGYISGINMLAKNFKDKFINPFGYYVFDKTSLEDLVKEMESEFNEK